MIEAIANGGTSFLWDANELSRIAKTEELLSLREFFQVKNWDEVTHLPSCGSSLLVIGGLDVALKCMKHEEALDWLQKELKPRVQAFHKRFQLQAGLCFFLSFTPGQVSYSAGKQDYLVNLREGEPALPLLTPVFGGYKDDAIRVIRQVVGARAQKSKEEEQIGVLIPR